MNRILLGLFLISLPFAFACRRDEVALTNTQQAQSDDDKIRDYLSRKGIVDYTRTTAGVYVKIDSARPDQRYLRNGDFVYVRYRARYLSDTTLITVDSNLVDSSETPFRVELGNTTSSNKPINGWLDGLRMFRKGEKGRMFIPSGLAYGTTGSLAVPPNANMVFDIEIEDVR